MRRPSPSSAFIEPMRWPTDSRERRSSSRMRGGSVAEVLNLSQLEGYTTGGTAGDHPYATFFVYRLIIAHQNNPESKIQ